MPGQGGLRQPDPAATPRSHPHPVPASWASRTAGVRWAARGATGPSRGRACQPQSPPAPPAPLSALRAAPSRPQGVRALQGRARRRAGEELGGAGRTPERRGGSRCAHREEPLGDPRHILCAAAAPGRSGASPLAGEGTTYSPRASDAGGSSVRTARRGSADKRRGGQREGRGGPGPHQATWSAHEARRGTLAQDKSVPEPENQA